MLDIDFIQRIFLDITFAKATKPMKKNQKILNPNNIIKAGKIFDVQ